MSEPVRIKLATVAPDLAPGRPGNGQAAATGEDVLLRLALWLADVAAEAALAATAQADSSTRVATATPRAGGAGEPSVEEPAL